MVFYLLITIALVLIGLLYFLGLRLIKNQVDALHALSGHFSGYIPWYSRVFKKRLSFVGCFSGHTFTFAFGAAHSVIIEYLARSKSKLRIYMYRSNPGPVLFAQRIYTNDAALDQYFLYSNMPSEAVLYFNDSSKLSAIKQLLQAGWEPPLITARKIVIEVKNITTEITPQFIQEMLERLIVLRN